jgi:hypothetical protein
MSDSAHMETVDAPRDSAALIDALRTAGADRFDPVRWHYLEALAKRASSHQGSIKRMLDAKLAQALAAYQKRFEQAQRDARESIAQSAQQYPQAANDLQCYFDAGDFKALRQLITSLKTREQCAPLSTLVRQLEQQAAENAEARSEINATPRFELKVIRNSRNTWAKLSVDKQVAKALQQAPKNAGPINSHMLVLRSLELMRDISPDYLNRFMSYAETLLCLDQGEKEKAEKDKPATPKKSAAKKTAKK